MKHVIPLFLGLCMLGPAVTNGQDADRAGVEFFELKIRPVLVKHCYECHSKESGRTRGGLKVDSRDALHAGGDTGPAIVPRSLDKSALYQAISYDGDVQMPPKGKLPAAVIADVRKWILMGAPDPRVTKIAPDVLTQIDIEKGRDYWAYQKPVRPTPPAVRDDTWPKSEIDCFVLARLEANKLTPVGDASPAVLIRRLYFVLTGLPPAPEAAQRWESQIESSGDAAVANLVDHLLDSPRFGERWGRHWMDVARFAESTGGDHNNIYHHAWRYRDYVIDSFNEDKPFDQFIREQIAGDLLPIASDEEWAENVIATGFLALGAKLVGEEDQQKYFADLVDEQIDATTRAFLATTVSCARCHDHKFDPIPQSDYYALAGIFRSTQTHYGLLPTQARQATTLLDLTGMGPPAGSPRLSEREYAALLRARDDARTVVEEAMQKIRSGGNVFRGTLRRIRSDRDETQVALQSYLNDGTPRVAMGVQDRDYPLDTRLLVRGDLDKPAQKVPRGVLQVLSESGRQTIAARSRGSSYESISGRLELADWIASDENPLTARVMANRVWHWMFGAGLVRTVDDFGTMGQPPTHPQLLDYLAVRLVENGWSVKSLIREIALSRTWRFSSDFDASKFAVDPDNRYLWRMNKQRLEAEAIRDAMLAASGNLDTERPIGTLLRDVGEGTVGQNVFEPVIRAIRSNHRSVYLPRVRSALPESLELFDAPDASLVMGARETTTSPLQSLFMMNNDLVQRQAEAAARRVAEQPAQKRLEYAFLLALSRRPTTVEREHAATFIRRLSDSSRLDLRQQLAAFCQALLCTAEFSSID